MPKKTKKQKILAEKRAAVSFETSNLIYNNAPLEKITKELSSQNFTFTHIKQDLLKTVIIGAIFIIGEFILAGFIGKK